MNRCPLFWSVGRALGMVGGLAVGWPANELRGL